MAASNAPNAVKEVSDCLRNGVWSGHRDGRMRGVIEDAVLASSSSDHGVVKPLASVDLFSQLGLGCEEGLGAINRCPAEDDQRNVGSRATAAQLVEQSEHICPFAEAGQEPFRTEVLVDQHWANWLGELVKHVGENRAVLGDKAFRQVWHLAIGRLVVGDLEVLGHVEVPVFMGRIQKEKAGDLGRKSLGKP